MQIVPPCRLPRFLRVRLDDVLNNRYQLDVRANVYKTYPVARDEADEVPLSHRLRFPGHSTAAHTVSSLCERFYIGETYALSFCFSQMNQRSCHPYGCMAAKILDFGDSDVFEYYSGRRVRMSVRGG